MHQRTCATCGDTFQPTHGRQRYCKNPCVFDNHPKVEKVCDCCGDACLKSPTSRYAATYCSLICRDYARWGGQACDLPSHHWARWYGQYSNWQPPAPKPTPSTLYYMGTCADCESPIVERAYGVPSRWCSDTCARRVSRRARKAREHQAVGSFKWADVIRQFIRQGKTCAYCHADIDGMPDPEHVIPISRGGDNSMSNIVAACRPCNADKRDLTPEEWAIDRKRRGLMAVDTSLSGIAFTHLALNEPTARTA